MKEIWKDVPGWPNYAVSNTGAVYNKVLCREIKQRENYKGYMLVDFTKPKKRVYRVHSLVWMAFVTGSTEITTIDHKNRDKKDNRLENLRACTNAQNSHNIGLSGRKNMKSKYKGVCTAPREGSWRASIRINKVNHHIGVFDSEIEAAKAYDKSALENYGDFACTNEMLGLYE